MLGTQLYNAAKISPGFLVAKAQCIFQNLHLALTSGWEKQISSPGSSKYHLVAMTLSRINGDAVLCYVKQKLISMPCNSVHCLYSGSVHYGFFNTWILVVSVSLQTLPIPTVSHQSRSTIGINSQAPGYLYPPMTFIRQPLPQIPQSLNYFNFSLLV